MAARVSHINDMMASRIDRARQTGNASRKLSVATLAAIFVGADTPKRLLGVEFVEDRCPETNAIIVPARTVLASCQDIEVNGLDFASGLVRPVFG